MASSVRISWAAIFDLTIYCLRNNKALMALCGVFIKYLGRLHCFKVVSMVAIVNFGLRDFMTC